MNMVYKYSIHAYLVSYSTRVIEYVTASRPVTDVE
jgi:hypothetical protein